MDSDEDLQITSVISINDKSDETDNEAIDKCEKWLSNCNLSDCSTYDNLSICSEKTTSCDDNFSDIDSNGIVSKRNNNVNICDAVVVKDETGFGLNEIIKKQPNRFSNIRVTGSEHVHIGDITHINGPVFINSMSPTISQNITVNNIYYDPEAKISIVPRKIWLAQPPLDPEDCKEFAELPKFVIFLHSASEEAFTQSENNLLVRLIQQFHIESHKRNDISYNFLIGAEGSIYEGRGWKLIGANAFGYNQIAIGICFIGCYTNKLPPPVALQKAKALMDHGLRIGALDKDYKILTHKQCSSTESPGSKLHDEIKTWDRWDSTVSVDNPSPLNKAL